MSQHPLAQAQFGKEALSKYISTDCKKAFAAYLRPHKAEFMGARQALGIPEPQTPRPGLVAITEEGRQWEAEKVADLAGTLGADHVVGMPRPHASGQTRYGGLPLAQALAQAAPSRFLVEAEYAVGLTFQQALAIAHYGQQFGLTYAGVRPDLIQVCEPGRFDRQVRPDGATEPLSPKDTRCQLRVIDIKLTSHPGARYFAEVAYYGMVLAGWLADHDWERHFVVVPDGAIWAGSHDASHLRRTHRELERLGGVVDTTQLLAALEQDLEPAHFDVFALRLRQILQRDLPEVLAARAWQTIPFHVDNRCTGCEYLGYPRNDARGDPAHCMPTAARQDHLSQVAFLGRGASASLTERGLAGVADLAHRDPGDAVFDGHQDLRAERTVVSARALALEIQEAALATGSGSTALLPKWAALQVYVSADFDIASAITFAFGLEAMWQEPRPREDLTPDAAERRRWEARVYPVDQRDVAAERRELLRFLTDIDGMLTWVEGQDTARRETAANTQPPLPANQVRESTVQFYVWDTLQQEHFARVVGRHLDAILADRRLSRLAWLFPPDDLLPNPQLISRPSALTVVKEVVRPLVAAPVAHYYSLLDVARAYHPPHLTPNQARFSVHPLFEGELSDQIPSERAHEIWAHAPNWARRLAEMEETIGKRLFALRSVVYRLGTDLRGKLTQEAPLIRRLGPVPREDKLGADSQLWLAFAKLNAALDAFEVQQDRSRPAHEREARFKSARLEQRLVGEEEAEALSYLGLGPRQYRRVYRLAPGSRELKVKPGDFDRALAPAAEAGFLDRVLLSLIEGTNLAGPYYTRRWDRLERLVGVSVAGIDRERRLLAVDPDQRLPGLLDDLEHAGLANLSVDVMLDPTHKEFLVKKLRNALRAIGYPQMARDNPLAGRLAARAIGPAIGRGPNRVNPTPASDVLWGAAGLHAAPVPRDLAAVREALEAAGISLNPTQWEAWRQGLSRRLQLIWGPPGTGKSTTAVAIILGAAAAASLQRRPVRILVSAFTYTAIDNVLRGVLERLDAHPSLAPGARLARLRSGSRARSQDPWVPVGVDVEVNTAMPGDTLRALRGRLERGEQVSETNGDFGVTIVAATAEQTYNLLGNEDNGSLDLRGLFDLILVDEASQMDVAHAILPLCTLAEGGSLVLAGDPRQLAPIHAAEPPEGLAAMVGSFYTFCRDVHRVPDLMLDTNYRANATLVSFAREAGYGASLSSYSPDLRIEMVGGLPTSASSEPPTGWPTCLHWTPAWAALLDPTKPAVCFLYPEGRSSQWNRFEADSVAALTWLLHGRLGDQLLGERDRATGRVLPTTGTPYTPADFWDRGVGIVTPHRAQQGLVISRLQHIFAGSGVSAAAIRGAVDTVERFQGQERDVILATFALGDTDAIRDEEEFLFGLERFNVLASRARAKLIVLVSDEVVDHLASESKTLAASRLLKVFAYTFCGQGQAMQLGYLARIIHGE